MAGTSLVIADRSPDVEIWGVEPHGFDDLRRSLETGTRQGAPPSNRSLCDALESPMTGEITFPILKDRLAGAVTVDDAEIAEAMRYAFRVLKLVVEPGGVAGLAALLASRIELGGRTAAVILSGGNVDPDLFARIVTDA
jgi:threonine dehydratase